MTLKAISLKQPWANLVCCGAKTIETRKWKTKYRGDLLICSSASPKIEPYGKALCIVELYDIEPMTREHEKETCVELYPGAYAWYLRNLRILKKPFPVKGQLNIFNLEVEDQDLKFKKLEKRGLGRKRHVLSKRPVLPFLF